jgi:hypothetical protein
MSGTPSARPRKNDADRSAPSGDVPSPLDRLSKEIDAKLDALAAGPRAPGATTSARELVQVERLIRVRDLLLKRNAPSRHRSLIVVGVAVLAAMGLWAAYTERPNADVELELQTTRAHLELPRVAEAPLVPGELGEMLALSRATVSGMEEADPPVTPGRDSLELREAEARPGVPRDQLALRLQGLALPTAGPFSLTVAASYGPGTKGFSLSTSKGASTVHFSEVIAVSDEAGGQLLQPRPVSARGKTLKVELFPQVDAELTVLRNVPIASITFDKGMSPIVGGRVLVADLPSSQIAILPGDELEIAGGQLLVRQVSYRAGIVKVTLSGRDVATLGLGLGSKRSLIPTYLDWIRARWPGQLYATVTALLAALFGIGRWWKGS